MDVDDEEIIVKGTQLHYYLTEHFYDTVSGSCKDPHVSEEQTPKLDPLPDTSTKLVDSQMYSFVDCLLQSDLLLEEDASYLFGAVSELSIAPANRMYKMGLKSVIIILTATLSFVFSKTLFCMLVPGILYIIYLSLPKVIELIFINRCQKKLAKLVLILKTFHSFVRKASQSLQEQLTLVCQKKLKNELRSASEQTSDVVILEKKQAEIMSLQKLLHKSLMGIIYISRQHTIQFRSSFPLDDSIDLPDKYLAFSPSKELGIDFDSEDGDHVTPNLGSLEGLKDVYVMMQSETLKRLGLCFCPNMWGKPPGKKEFCKLFNALSVYHTSCENLLTSFIQRYKIHFMPQVFKNSKESIAHKCFDATNAVHNLSLALDSLVFEVKSMENYFNFCNDELDVRINTMIENLKEIETEFCKASDMLREASKCFNKLKKTESIQEESKKTVSDTVSSPANSAFEESRRISVGYSDFSPKGTDRVYTCITRSEESDQGSCDQEEFYDVHEPQLPPSVLSELKVVLRGKKKEFEDREAKAIELNEDYNQYMDFDDSDSSMESSSKGGGVVPENLSHTQSSLFHEILESGVFSNPLKRMASDEVTYVNDSDTSD